MRCVENSEYLCSSTDNFRYVVEKITICNVVYNKGDNIAYMKFYERLERWSHLLRSKALYYELKYYIDKKRTHIKRLLYFNNRGIGKTYNLMKLSGKYGIPVIEPNYMECYLLYKTYQKFNPIVISSNCLRGRVEPGSIVLVDEKQCFDENAKSELENYIQIGFETVN